MVLIYEKHNRKLNNGKTIFLYPFPLSQINIKSLHHDLNKWTKKISKKPVEKISDLPTHKKVKFKNKKSFVCVYLCVYKKKCKDPTQNN